MHTSRPTRLRSFAPLLGLFALGLALVVAGCGRLGLDRDVSTGASPSPDADQVAAVIDGERITYADLEAHMQQQFIEQVRQQPADRLYEMRETAVRDLVEQHIVETEARARGITPEALRKEVLAEAGEPSVEEVAAWYAANQGRLRGARLEDVASNIAELLQEERRSMVWNGFLTPKLEALDWQMVLAPPRQELEATRLVRGPVDAPVTIMTFSDYQCPYCIRSEPVLAEVLARYPEQVRLVHRHFPLDSIHPFARPAAEAAMCADEQGRFWDFHDAIFARQGRLAEDSFTEIGDELGLDLPALEQCIAERRYQAFVDADFAAGRDAGVTGTPAFFVNGIALKGARNADELSRVVDAELARLGGS